MARRRKVGALPQAVAPAWRLAAWVRRAAGGLLDQRPGTCCEPGPAPSHVRADAGQDQAQVKIALLVPLSAQGQPG